ncbi:hypothetical protein Tco_1019837, partial [Tanacetum coccineum]
CPETVVLVSFLLYSSSFSLLPIPPFFCLDSKRDMGSYISTMKPSDVKALTRKYKIPRDLHPVAVSSEWTMDRLTDEYIGLYEQYFEFAGLRVPFSTFLLAVIRHFHVHISQLVPLDISDPAPKNRFDEADVIALTHQSIDIRDPEGNVVTMSEYLRLPFLSRMTIEAGEALTEQNVIPQHITTPLSAKFLRRTGEPKVTVGRGEFEEAINPLQIETQGDNLVEIPAHDSANTITRLYEEHHDEHSGVFRIGMFVILRNELWILKTEPIPLLQNVRIMGSLLPRRRLLCLIPFERRFCVGVDGAGSSLPPSLFVPSWGILQRSPSDHSGGGERSWFSLARGAMAHAHALCQFESLYDTHHALQESLETTRGQLVWTREDFNVVQNFYNTLSEKHRKLREEHAHYSEGLVVVQAEKNSLMATNAEQTLRITELEQQLKSVHDSSSLRVAVKDLESPDLSE